MRRTSLLHLGFLILLLAGGPAAAQPATAAKPATATPAATATAKAAAKPAAIPAPLVLTLTWPENLDRGKVELRLHPSAREAAAYFLRGEETPATQSLPVGGLASRNLRIEAPFGFWLLTYSDSRGRRLEASLAPLATSLDLGELAPSPLHSELQVTDGRGAPVAGALVAFRAAGPRRLLWQSAAARLVAGADGKVFLPRPETRGDLWILAPGFRPYLEGFRPDELPRRIALQPAVPRSLTVVDRLRRPLVNALVSTGDGLPLGFTGAAGELEGAFEENDALWVEDAAGRRWRAAVASLANKKLRLQVAAPLAYTGEVVDRRAEGRALPGALVAIAGHPETWRLADAQGRFSLAAPPDDRTLAPQVEAFAAGFSRASVQAGDSELTLALERADRVLAGLVTDQDGEPLEGARVEVADRDRRFTWSATTGDDGQYRLAGLPAGALWAEAAKETYLPAKEPLNRAFTELRLDFHLASGQRLVGQLIGAHGQVVAGGAIALAGASASEPPEPLGLTDREGNFVVGSLAPGRHLLVFTAPGLARHQLEALVPAGEEEVDLGAIEMADEETFGGRVVGDDDEPLADAAIFVWRDEAERELLLEWPTWRTPDATSAGDGSFQLPGLTSGETVGLEIRVPGRPPIFAKNVAIGPGDAPDFVVPQGAALEVEVLDSGREPLANAEVTLVRLGVDQFENFQLTDRKGRAFYPALPAGALELQVESRNYGVYRRALELEKGEAASVQVVLGEDGSALDGRVYLPDGQPASGLMVFVDTGERTSPPPVFTRIDEQGFYHLEGLPSGTVAVEVSGRNKYSPIYRRRITLDAPQNQLDIELPEASVREIAVRVVSEDGQPLEGIGVSVYYKKRKGGIVSLSRRTDGEGIALFGEVPQATYEIMAWAPDETWRSGEARLKLDEPRKEIDVVLVRKTDVPPLE